MWFGFGLANQQQQKKHGPSAPLANVVPTELSCLDELYFKELAIRDILMTCIILPKNHLTLAIN